MSATPAAAAESAAASPQGPEGARPPMEATEAGTTGNRAQLALPVSWPWGVDVASWQHTDGADIDWRAVRRSGASFAIVKATEGAGYTNPYFGVDRARARDAGLVVGAYHYARPALPLSTATDQARHFLNVTGATRSEGHLAPALDLEVTGGLGAEDLTAWTSRFLNEIESQTGRTPVLYTYRSFWTDIMKNTQVFAKYPLWFAIYNDSTSPGPLPGGWTRWMMWQHTSRGSVPGIVGNVDMNVFCCARGTLSQAGEGRFTEISGRYFSDPAVAAALGAAREQESPTGGGRWQLFEHGLLFFSVPTGVREVLGAISYKYLSMGGTASVLGRPVSDEKKASAPGSRQSEFEGGRIYWSEATGAHEVHGAILRRYVEMGGTISSLGLPTSDEFSVPGGRASDFQFGRMIWTEATNAIAIGSP